jgi:hypothetical protein
MLDADKAREIAVQAQRDFQPTSALEPQLESDIQSIIARARKEIQD